MKVHDDVCSMEIETENAAASVRFEGKMYYFCSERCRRTFEEHPDRYVSVSGKGEGPGDHRYHHH